MNKANKTTTKTNKVGSAKIIDTNNHKSNKFLPILTIVTLTIIVYLRVFQNQLTNWDDDIYVLGNPYINPLNLKNLVAIFTHFYCGNYHPFSMLCYSIAFQLGDINPWVYQLMNLFFHVGNSVLVYFFVTRLLRLSGASEKSISVIPFITALLFGIHTLHVESVAWVSENKNVLYTFFFLLSLLTYLRFLEHRKSKFFLFAFVLCLFSLLSKGTAVSLSVTLLAIDLFLGRKLLDKKVILEKVPFILLSLIFGIVAVYAQKSTSSVLGKGTFSLFERISFASYGLVQYITKLILPINLSALYPYPTKTAGGGIPSYFYLFPFLVTGVLAFLFFTIRNKKEYLFGTLFFLINIFLVLQLMPVGDAYMADRYCYVPSIGILFMISVFYFKKTEKSAGAKKTLPVIGGIYLLIIFVLTFMRIGTWKDSLTLWNDVLSKYTNNPKTWNNRGVAYSLNKEYEKSILDFNKAIQIKPDFREPYMNRGTAYKFMGKYQEALQDFNKLAVLDPKNGFVFNNRGTVFSDMGNLSASLEDYTRAISLNKNNAVFFCNRADLKIKMKEYNSAIADCDSALKIDIAHAEAYNIRGLAKKSMNDLEGALIDFNNAISINKDFADAIFNRGNLYKETGKGELATADFDKAASMGKSSDEAIILRGLEKMQKNDNSGALDDFNQALQISPSFAGFMNRGVLLANMGKFTEAIADYNKAIEMDPKSSLAYMNRCNARINTKEYREALVDINVSISLNPANGVAYINRGIVKVMLADYSGAIDDLNVALKNNEHPAAYYYRGVAKINSGNKQSGCSDIQKAKELGYTPIEPAVLQTCQ